MGSPLGSFALIQFSPPSAQGETKERRFGRRVRGKSRREGPNKRLGKRRMNGENGMG